MTIPDKIKIGGMVFTVEQSVGLNDGEKMLQGQIDHQQTKITLLSTNGQQQREMTMLHEILHGIFYFLGYWDDYNDEHKVDSLAHALYMVIKDNPKLFAE